MNTIDLINARATELYSRRLAEAEARLLPGSYNLSDLQLRLSRRAWRDAVEELQVDILPIGTKTLFGTVVKYGSAYWCVPEGSNVAEAHDAGMLEASVEPPLQGTRR